MAQPVAAPQPVVIGTIGTTVVSSESASLQSILLPGTFVGTVIFHNASSAAGTSATSPVYTVGIPLLNQYKDIKVNAQFNKGIVVEATGTPTLTFTWDK